ncbi:MAG TPA: diguanylate cyclase [Steroidobacteraceae bacterium]|nr:diguanylate cyclase [Steroidobacteraceae bacterium]
MLLLVSGIGAAQAQVTCFISTDPVIRKLQELAARDATATLPLLQTELATARAASPVDQRRIASLLAVQAQSYSILELDSSARESALAGMALVPDVNDPVHLELLSVHSENVYGEASIDAAIKSLEAARTQLVPDSALDSCLRIALGTAQYRQDRSDLAIVNLMQAYQTAQQFAWNVQRRNAASQISKVMRDMGDYTQALALNAEVIEFDTAQNASLSLSVSRYLRGSILKEMREFPAAIDQFAKARELSVELDDIQGIAFSDMDICAVQVQLGEFAEARKRCENAQRIFTAAKSWHLVKESRSGLASIDLEEGHTARALATLNELLANGAADVPPRDVPALFQLRSRANATLGNFREAHADLNEYLRRTTAVNDTRRIKQVATLRARFETNRQLERNAELKRELDGAKTRQMEQKRWTAIAIGTGALIIALLVIHAISMRRHRQQLAQLANSDSLTGLPNRRHTYEKGKAAMEKAAEERRPLTVAVVDLDHFKSINDRCGHAAGDNVLREFASVCRESIRSTDIIGRWGGEEFLIVMPGATLDVALIALERLRGLALRIALPPTGAGLQVGLSAGLASLEASVKTLDELIARADAALYKAKHEGRDLVRIAAEDFDNASSGVLRALR